MMDQSRPVNQRSVDQTEAQAREGPGPWVTAAAPYQTDEFAGQRDCSRSCAIIAGGIPSHEPPLCYCKVIRSFRAEQRSKPSDGARVLTAAAGEADHEGHRRCTTSRGSCQKSSKAMRGRPSCSCLWSTT